MSNKKFRVKTVNQTKNKTVKSDGTVSKSDGGPFYRPDRIIANLSMEPFNGCWVGFGYESDVMPGETLSEAKERVQSEVEATVQAKVEEIIEANN
jgi:hypothetical protein